MRAIDSISIFLGTVAAWFFVATGLMLTYEVVARYALNAPTIWAAEISQILMIAGVFMALGVTLHRRQHIMIEALYSRFSPFGKKLADTVSLLFIGVFAAAVCYWGFGIALDSYLKGRSSGTMLNIPNWWSEALVPLGLGLLFLQCLAELLRVWTGSGWRKPGGHEGHIGEDGA
ncbi:TRAP transporter small permease subunit [Denitrobaculum tricleocarpae]|uniref:TRAP transporter small permease protein n=1 Tax=Denitrobaculum tricleocarpae TaxID=2591009 RepID=A0A545TRB5_9PROT|nr:TRAP transporter small permease [Denitrobaculum tricleocarpae]TQV79762.1 TRAP transporter small permease [Denitrobaculum tricleocarpae]